jgi:uncharacterized iron-regulated protein
MNRFPVLFFMLLLALPTVSAQVPFAASQLGIFDGTGREATMDEIVAAAIQSDAIFLGEQHDDAVAHAVQLELLKRIVYAAGRRRNVVLSLEMFERDTQIVLDEYLGGLISETHFITSSRAWPNYKSDYKPLVEFAKANRLAVVAANAPRRYVNMVSRGRRGSLNNLSRMAKAWLAPLPFADPSPAYAAKFRSLMGGSGEASMGLENILAAQSLWDATMADSIAKALTGPNKPLVVHLNGSFHSEGRLGTVEHLQRYRPKAKSVVVTMRYEKDFKTFNKVTHTGLGDFVLLTDAGQPRSRR